MTELGMKNRIKAIVLVAFLSLLAISTNAWSYNKSWDQGHKCVNPSGGEDGWGRYDYNGNFQGGYSSKECCEKLCKACPVYANTGRYQKTFTDLTVPGVGPVLALTRTYNSQEWSSGLLGYNWTFNFGRRIIISRNNDGEKIIGVLQRTGEKNYFREELDGTLTRITDYGLTYDLAKKPDGSYLIYEKDGSHYELRADGKISKIVDKNQNELVFSYNSVGCLSRITNASGNYVDVQLGANGKIASLSDNLGRTVIYGYDTHANLISVTDPMGNTTQYTYNAKKLLTSIIDPLDQTIESVTYDTHQPPRVSTLVEKGESFTIAYYSDRTEKTDAYRNQWTYYFNNVGVIERIVDPLGHSKNHQLNKLTLTSVDWDEDLNGNRTLFTYDDEANINSVTDPMGNTWSYTYVSGTDSVASETDPTGVVTQYQYDADGNLTSVIRDAGGPNEMTTTYAYDANGNRISVTDPLGNTTTFTYDSNGMVTKITQPSGDAATMGYNTRGNLISKTDAAGNTTTYTYDLNGNLLSITDPLDRTTTFEYDAKNRVSRKTLPSGAQESVTYDAFDRVLTHVNAESESTAYTYSMARDTVTTPEGKLQVTVKDPLGRVTSIVTKINDTNIAVADSDDMIQTFVYDAAGNLLTVSTPAGVLVQNTYNANNKLTQSQKAGEQAIAVTYNENGNPLTLTRGENTYQYTYNTLQALTQVNDGFGVLSTRSYDAMGRVVAETGRNGQSRQIAYDADGKSQGVQFGDGGFFNVDRDAADHVRTITSNDDFVIQRNYDGAGRLNALTLPDQSTIQVTYDALDYINSLIDARGNTTLFLNDQLGRRTQETFPDNLTRIYAYQGNLLGSFTNRAGQTTQYQYDGASRLTTIIPPEGQNTITYAYNQNGSMTSAQTGTHNTSFTYGADTHLTATTSDGRTIQYSRSSDNLTQTATYPGGLQVTRTFDDRGRLLSITSDGLSLYGLTWTEAQPDTVQMGNGITGAYTYGVDRVPATQIFQLNGTTVQHLEFIAKPLGIIDGVRDHVTPENSLSYQRDARGRLTGFAQGVMDGDNVIGTPVNSQTWQFDGIDNWETFIDNGDTHNRFHDALNRLTQDGQTTYTYDAVGNLISDGSRTFSYDFQNNLTRITLADTTTIDFEYDALGRRVSKTVGGVTTQYVYDNNRLVETYVNGQLHAFYVYLNHSASPDDIVAARIDGNWYYVLKNLQGSVVALTDASGQIVETYSYDAYGQVTMRDASNQPITTSLNIHFFAGMLLDHETGLYYARSRYYNPELGRFLSPDPLSWVSSGGSSNDYAFGDSDPSLFIDPFGKFPSPSKQCSGHRVQFAIPNLGIFEKLIGKPKGEFLIDWKTCQRCCSSGPHKGQVVSEKSLSLTAQIKWSSPCVPVIIPGLPPLGWKTAGGACAGLFVAGDVSAQGSAFGQEDKCNDSVKGGGCIGIGVNGWLRGGYSGDILDAWAGGAITGSGKVCLVGDYAGFHVRGQVCIGGKLAARIQLKKVTIWFIKKPYYEYTFWQGSWCTPTWEIL